MSRYDYDTQYDEEPNAEVVECGSCGAYHRPEYTGDCRNDMERFETYVGYQHNDHTVRVQLDDIYIKQLQKLLWEACNFIIDHKTKGCDCNRCDLIRRVHEYQSIVDRRWV